MQHRSPPHSPVTSAQVTGLDRRSAAQPPNGRKPTREPQALGAALLGHLQGSQVPAATKSARLLVAALIGAGRTASPSDTARAAVPRGGCSQSLLVAGDGPEETSAPVRDWKGRSGRPGSERGHTPPAYAQLSRDCWLTLPQGTAQSWSCPAPRAGAAHGQG